jgi:hypothetical protein
MRVMKKLASWFVKVVGQDPTPSCGYVEPVAPPLEGVTPPFVANDLSTHYIAASPLVKWREPNTRAHDVMLTNLATQTDALRALTHVKVSRSRLPPDSDIIHVEARKSNLLFRRQSVVSDQSRRQSLNPVLCDVQATEACVLSILHAQLISPAVEEVVTWPHVDLNAHGAMAVWALKRALDAPPVEAEPTRAIRLDGVPKP